MAGISGVNFSSLATTQTLANSPALATWMCLPNSSILLPLCILFAAETATTQPGKPRERACHGRPGERAGPEWSTMSTAELKSVRSGCSKIGEMASKHNVFKEIFTGDFFFVCLF